jgi:hypothetical protein
MPTASPPRSPDPGAKRPRGLRQVVLVGLLLALPGAGRADTPVAGPRIRWLSDDAAAFAQARASGRAVDFTVLLFDPRGRLLDRIEGIVGPGELLERLEAVEARCLTSLACR